MQQVRKRRALCLILFLLLLCAPAQAALPEALSAYNAPNMRIGLAQGAASMTAGEAAFPNAQFVYHESAADGYLALEQGKIDAYVFDEISLRFAAARLPHLKILDETLSSIDLVVGLSKIRPDLVDPVNQFIRTVRADGTLDDMYERWVIKAEETIPEIAEPESPEQTIRVGTSGLIEPMTYYGADRQLTGYDIEFSKRLALFLNAKVELTALNYTGLVAACESGAIDLIVANLNATPERAQVIHFSEPYLTTHTAVAVKAEGSASPDLNYYAGKNVGVLTGSTFDLYLQDFVPGAVPQYYNNNTDLTQALLAGKIEGFLMDDAIARSIEMNNPSITYRRELFNSQSYAFALAKGQEELRDKINAVLERFQQDGTLQDADARWFGADESLKVLPDLPEIGKNGTLRACLDPATPPFAYIKDGAIVGYDVEILMRICAKLGYGLEISRVDFSSMIPGLVSGAYDIAVSCITVTPEREESVLFTLPNYTGGITMVMPRDGFAGAEDQEFWSSLQQSFVRNFVTEDRWQMIVSGLLVTLLISVLSGIFGSVLGFVVCLMRRCKRGVARIPASLYIRIVQGTPIVVLLMILYYVVFRSFSPVAVSVISFSLNFGAYASEMMRTGIEAVDQGQIEAASALGFNRLRSFWKITFPQAARHFLPVFKGEFISMVKMTSVVGYVSVQDLTKVSDIIRSRTYEAFFPLIATALIYFALAYALASLLTLVELRIDPMHRERVLKGVKTK